MGPLTWLAAGAVLVVGVLLGAPWWAVLGAALLYGTAALMGGRAVRVLLLVAAPAGIAATSGALGVVDTALAAAAMGLAMVPLMRSLGPAVPWRPLPVFMAGALVPLVLVRLSPWRHLADSDLAARVDVALLAVGLLLAVAVAPYVRPQE